MRPSRNRRQNAVAGFTLIELMLVVSIIGILASLAGVKYLGFVEKARIARAIAEIRGIAIELDSMLAEGADLPESLAELGVDDLLDPWGSAYYYLAIEGQLPAGMSMMRTPLPLVSASPPDSSSGGGGDSNPDDAPDGGGGRDSNPDDAPDGGGGNVIGSARKDRFMVPINSDYDLYSAGSDGATKAPLQTPVSRDDVIRAGDGSYYGLAENF